MSACLSDLPLLGAAQVRALRKEAGELRGIVGGYREAEQRVRPWGRGESPDGRGLLCSCE